MDSDIKLTLICAVLFISIGIFIGSMAHSHIKELQHENIELMQINYELEKENDSLRYCVPTTIKGRAVVSYVNGNLFCEVHNKA